MCKDGWGRASVRKMFHGLKGQMPKGSHFLLKPFVVKDGSGVNRPTCASSIDNDHRKTYVKGPRMDDA